MSNALTGKDVLQIDGRIISDLADADSISFAPEEELAVVKAGKNGNSIFSENRKGKMGKLTLRLVLGSPDDKYLNSRLHEQLLDFSKFILLAATYSKRSGDGGGKQTTVVYQFSGGLFSKAIPAKTSSEGDTEQSVAVYEMMYANHDRSEQ